MNGDMPPDPSPNGDMPPDPSPNLTLAEVSMTDGDGRLVMDRQLAVIRVIRLESGVPHAR